MSVLVCVDGSYLTVLQPSYLPVGVKGVQIYHGILLNWISKRENRIQADYVRQAPHST